MKKLTLLVGITTILFVGCQKENSNENGAAPITSINQKQISFIRAVRLDANGKSSEIPLTLRLSDYQKNGTPELNSLRQSNHLANGHFKAEGYTVCFSAVQNNSGTHGFINVIGQYAYQYSYQMECTCLQVNGNDAIIGGVITSVQNNGGLPFVAVGNYIYWRVKDNGSGSNSPADQVNDLTIFNPYSLCDVDMFQMPWLNFVNVMPGGYIKVK